jgi:signal recognition particle receptor subunit beta
LEHKKIMILGGNSGKDIILGRICEKNVETVAMEYGNVHHKKQKLHFFSVPSPERFGFMYHILSKDINGVLVLVEDNGLKTGELEALNLYKQTGIPQVILAYSRSKENVPLDVEENVPLDLEECVPPDLGLKGNISLIYIDSMNEEDISRGVEMLLEKIDATKNLEQTRAYTVI